MRALWHHDWKTASADPHPDQIPLGYERFWRQFGPGQSQQPIDITKRGGARYEHVKDIDGWRLVFVDTGPCNHESWPVGDDRRAAWLRRALTETPGRAKIVFSHAGGHGHDEASGIFTGVFQPISGTRPDFKDDDNWCVTRIDLLSPNEARVSILSFGADKPPRVTEPAVLKQVTLTV